MEPNPYQPAFSYVGLSQQRFSLSEGRLLVAVLAPAASTVAGVPVSFTTTLQEPTPHEDLR